MDDKKQRYGQSLLLEEGAKIMLPLLFLVSLYLLYYGKDHPGGGFSGGLVFAAAFALDIIAFGTERSRRALFVHPQVLSGAGIIISLLSGIGPMVKGKPFLTASWIKIGSVEFGTPILFDTGIYLVVAGTVLIIIFSLAEK